VKNQVSTCIRIRRSYMTLLETLIALSLLSVLLVMIFGFFREISYLGNLSEKTQRESFKMRYVESRLMYIFSRIVNENANDRKFFFYLQSPQRDFTDFSSLIVSYNNEVRIDPNFSGDVLGRLYVDKEGRLHLTTWPLYVDKPQEYMQDEILLENIKDIQYEFYAATPLPNEQRKKESPQPEPNQWQSEWIIAYHQMPSIVKITIQINNDSKSKEDISTFIFSFVLPSSKNPIRYLD
jgi:hypothetical protein